MMRRDGLTAVCAALGLTAVLFAGPAAADRTLRFERANGAGGQAAGINRRFEGAQGGSAVHRRVVRSDGAGNAAVNRGTVWQGPNGAQGARGSSNRYGADGSLDHRGAVTASGAHGSITSKGGFSRDAEGDVTQNRQTTLTNAGTGNSYQGSSSYDASSGFTHSGTCYDAAGNTIVCPSR